MTDCEECGDPADCVLPDLAVGNRPVCRECCPWPHDGDGAEPTDEEPDQLTLWESIVDTAQATFTDL